MGWDTKKAERTYLRCVPPKSNVIKVVTKSRVDELREGRTQCPPASLFALRSGALPAGILLQLRIQAHLLQGNGIEIVALRVVQVVGKHGYGAPIVGVVFAGAFIDAI